jgi:hypothetical protein
MACRPQGRCGFPEDRSARLPGSAAAGARHDVRMSYAVVWQEEDGTVFAGKLELAERTLRLDGLSRVGAHHRRVLRYADLGSVRSARRGERIGDRPTLVVEHRSRPPLRIGSVGGSGLLSEVADKLTAGTFAV